MDGTDTLILSHMDTSAISTLRKAYMGSVKRSHHFRNLILRLRHLTPRLRYIILHIRHIIPYLRSHLVHSMDIAMIPLPVPQAAGRIQIGSRSRL